MLSFTNPCKLANPPRGMVPAEATTNVMNATPITEKPEMKIGYRRSNDGHYSQPLFVVVSRFETDSFPVRVRHFRLGQAKASETLLGASSLERQAIPQRKQQGKLNPSGLRPKSLDVAPGTARRVSTHS
jgi:hypothetical protein